MESSLISLRPKITWGNSCWPWLKSVPRGCKEAPGNTPAPLSYYFFIIRANAILSGMKAFFIKLYLFVKTTPDRLYPFKCEIEGKFVRGLDSYTYVLNQAFTKYGPNHLGYKLMVYRSCFHLFGAVVFIILSAVISERFFGSDTALYILMAVAIVALFAQEFYYHPKFYGQIRSKGITDWLTWVVPMMFYIAIF